ncbi:hypothetical protein [Nocardia sp. NPDC005366]|uniref:hypothetical protein n=1 Tax=Nocardia sp. NPDC005366 TaxID=3156878 RepID=UPI0033B7A767
MVTLGVSTERGAVHAVALADSGERLPERVLAHRVERTFGDTKADVAAAVEAAMDEVAAEIGPDQEIGGAAVVYRDPAERRAIVTRLAAGPWQSTSLVSTKSAHLSVAAMMTWLKEFDHLLICEVVPGHQSFTLVDRARSRVLAATSSTGRATREALGAAVSAAWDQLEAAAVRADAVVLIGSGAEVAAVRAALERFGAPVLPCAFASSAPAVGAALTVSGDTEDVTVAVEQGRYGRGTAALFAAASVLAGGVMAGGIYTLYNISSTDVSAVASDTSAAVDSRGQAGTGPVNGSGAAGGSTAGPPVRPGFDVGRVPAAGTDSWAGEPTVMTTDTGGPRSRVMPQLLGSHPLPVDESESSAHESETTAMSQVPGTAAPDPAAKVGPPNDFMLFPGEAPPPPAFTAESQRWWDNHFRLLMSWAAQQF